MSIELLGTSQTNSIIITFGTRSSNKNDVGSNIYINKEQHDKIFKRVHYELKTKYKTIKCKMYYHKDLELCIIQLPTKQQTLICHRINTIKSQVISNMIVDEVIKDKIEYEYFPIINKYDREIEQSIIEFQYDGINIRFINDGLDGKYHVQMSYYNKSKVNNLKASVMADIINKEFGKI